ncbi:c-type cytochrome [Bacillus sp. FJAT-49705]|uniref:C-type cytochrome n=1 Tax=Cytobacillus citreus TaxID=2833586 RepID=A0ABS5NM90_9BACI|nr:c-type cytochrome [Cytobacillus citreus]MBS4188922.1 c-type cytochrome [Cytobacillus citreus]
MIKRLLIGVGSIVIIITILGFSISHVAKSEAIKTAQKAAALPPGIIKDHPYLPPSMDEVPAGEEGDLIRLGYKQHEETSTVLDGYDKSTLSCGSCHANGGVRSSLDIVGVTKTYPQYNSRAGKVMTIEDRINGCFKRSLNGTPLPLDSKEMKAFVAYYTYISQNVPDGTKDRPWAKLDKPKGDITKVNVDKGREIFNESCIVCHGEDGNGNGWNDLAVWGENSFNDGAGMNRIRTTAGFIKGYMPKVPVGGREPGSLSEQEAMDIAAYILSMGRPNLPEKIYDWPNGDAPDDAAYETLAGHKGDKK